MPSDDMFHRELKVKIQIYTGTCRLGSVPNEGLIGTISIELRVSTSLQDAIMTIVGQSLAPGALRPIRTQPDEVRSLFCTSLQYQRRAH
jgi:hypothetical protein